MGCLVFFPAVDKNTEVYRTLLVSSDKSVKEWRELSFFTVQQSALCQTESAPDLFKTYFYHHLITVCFEDDLSPPITEICLVNLKATHTHI